jgi:hypothetical protein
LVIADCLLLELAEQRPARLDKVSHTPTLSDDREFQKYRGNKRSPTVSGARFF